MLCNAFTVHDLQCIHCTSPYHNNLTKFIQLSCTQVLFIHSLYIYLITSALSYIYSHTSSHEASGYRNHRGDDGPHHGSGFRGRDGTPD